MYYIIILKMYEGILWPWSWTMGFIPLEVKTRPMSFTDPRIMAVGTDKMIVNPW